MEAGSFRPLTGIVPDCVLTETMDGLFSPPYGENPLSHGLRRASSPERGSLVQGNGSCKSSPFRGSWRAAPERVLRGEVEVWYKDFDGMAKKFLPPYGDGTMKKKIVKKYAQFSPPYGDGTRLLCLSMLTLLFSPPYGDGTSGIASRYKMAKLSPPYGDGTNSVEKVFEDIPFSPPCGDRTYL